MGMSASQARLLSITSRLTNNEFRAQTITNSKLRLATESQEASQKYMDALSSKKLVFGQYDANGDKTYTPLTANVLLSYGDLKNQYALVNTSGQILLPGSDIKTYMAANGDYLTYMQLNGVNTVEVENDEYTEQLQSILGADWAEYIYDTDFSSPQAVQDTLSGLTDKGLLKTINTLAGVTLEKTETDENIPYKASLNYAEGSIANLFNNGIASVNNAADYKALTDKLSYSSEGLLNSISSLRDVSGVMGKYIQTISNPPAWNIGNKPENFNEAQPTPDLFNSAKTLLSPQCWDDTGIAGLWDGSTQEPSDTNIWHMEHVLAQYVMSSKTDVINIEGETITNTGSIWGMSNGGGDGSDPMLVRNVLDKSENSDLKHDLQVFYYQVCKYIKDKNINNGLTDGQITEYGNIGAFALGAKAIGQKYKELIGKLLTAVAEDIISGCGIDTQSNQYILKEDTGYNDEKSLYNGRPVDDVKTFIDKYNIAYKKYKEEETAWQNRKTARKNEQDAWDNKLKDFKNKVTKWINSFDDLATKVQDAIDALGEPTKKVPDTTDAKYQWYTNLWYRMGGGAKIGTTEKLDKSNFVELDENLINNAEWLEFAFEHGILTLEQATFFEDGSEKYSKEMGQYDWVSKAYTNAVDIVSQDDEVAIAIAETKYKNTITEIENKDKKYDQDLKKLDTEHNALQTEYESVKEVITKNVERSFKAFS